MLSLKNVAQALSTEDANAVLEMKTNKTKIMRKNRS